MQKRTTEGTKKKGEEHHKQAFLSQINEVKPANQAVDPTMPTSTWKIDYVHGFGGDRNKASLYFGKDNNEIVFTSAALGIV